MLNIGEINYANVFPIFNSLKKYQNLKFVSSFPSFLNRAVREGGVDITPCSSIEYGRNSSNYLIIPEISISSITQVKSVCLFSNYDIKYLAGKKVFLTSESGTSVVLLKIIFKKFYDITVNFTINEMDADAFLYIGDKALFEYYNKNFKYIYDLGNEWYNFTSLPFVYALWLVTKEAVSQKKEEVEEFKNILLKIKSNSKQNLSALIDHYYFKGLSSYQIIDYWETIDYELSEKHIKGLKEFFKMAHEIGEIKSVPDINFLNV